jgi:hypothetical protein
MKAPGVIAIAGGMGALALLGLMMLQRSEPASDPAPALAVDGRAPAAPSQQPVHGSPSPPPRASVPMRPSQQAPAERPTPGAVEPWPAAAVEPASPAPPVAPSSPPVPAEVERKLTVARQSADESERLRAVKWLGEHADLYQFEALQQIQMNDPDAEVRRAAEAAANELRVRHADKPWPGIPQNADPQDYMRDVPEPSP